MTESAGDLAPDAEPAPPSWTRYFTAASIVLAIIALVVTVWSVGPAKLLSQISDIGLGFVIVLGIEIVITGFDSAALSGFLGRGGRRSSFLHVVRAQVSGRAINAVTPLASLGEATKATTLMERTSSSRAIAAVIHYNLAAVGIRLVTIAIGAPICALVLDLPEALSVMLLVGGAIAVVLLIAGGVLVRRGMLTTIIDVVRGLHLVSRARAERWRKQLAGIDRHLKPRRDQGQFERWIPAAWMIGSRVLSLTSMWVVLASVGYQAGPGTVAAVATAGTLISMLASVVPMGLGISEGSNAALFAALGAPASLGVTMVLGSRITLLGYAALGLFLIGASTAVGSARKVHDVRRARRHPPASGRGGDQPPAPPLAADPAPGGDRGADPPPEEAGLPADQPPAPLLGADPQVVDDLGHPRDLAQRGGDAIAIEAARDRAAQGRGPAAERDGEVGDVDVLERRQRLAHRVVTGKVA